MGGGAPTVRYRSSPSLIAEIKLLRDRYRCFRFNDDCFTANPDLPDLLAMLATFDLASARLLLAELHKLRVEALVFKGGGEPTLHPQFVTLISLAEEVGLQIGVVTNGSRLEGCAAELASRAAYVRVSIDGPTPVSHRAVHGTEDFDHILAGVEKLVFERGSRRHPVIGLSFAMDFAVISLVGEAVALGNRLGVDYVLLILRTTSRSSSGSQIRKERSLSASHRIDSPASWPKGMRFP